MKIVNEMPTSGQFVVVYEYEGSCWSDALMFICGNLHRHDDSTNEWVKLEVQEGRTNSFLTAHGAIYIVGEKWLTK